MSEESSVLQNRVHECSSFFPLLLDEAALVLYYRTCVTWLQYLTHVSLSLSFRDFFGSEISFWVYAAGILH